MNYATSNLNALSELGALDEKGQPVQSRLQDAKSAINLFHALRKADEGSAKNRARVDAMFDWANPYNQAQLNASGQGLMRWVNSSATISSI